MAVLPELGKEYPQPGEEQDTQDIIDSISHYIFGLMLVIISLWIIFYLLKQLSIYFEVDESKPNDTNSA